ncbi:hypothetical protein CCR83_03980 [Rhodobacter veldkampii DSM 11550]|uniref:Uncharacterized protein n=1 Tax=Phaeovulum veldkampii DSM 11550 TaxID=1185920 RepID=A0A2T4JHI4_9RHOB|nr:hypothetical protein [Phaeovulum veldkampii]MBK5945629.1 hypothetical protein [Phaeovulum veldkampii DSM 11550]PTE17237.1 hypothetical protein C5F46_10125 [Phaeovulum veldkampii DSM 11550]TDQ56246.1 hypothetical protein EV658_12017 [Phaeovulum veldkampii DSM 11550]
MALPPRVYYTLQEVTARWGCNIADVAGWADASRFRILTGIPAIRCGDEVVAGKVVLSPMELLPLFRRCGTGPTEGVMRRIQPMGRQDWLLITDPAGGIPVAVADMLILAEEVHAFEEENDMVRRVAAGPGAATPYDWEGMNIALIVRIHDHGLPATQAELVAEMQDWFADRSDGKKMPDSRSIRRRITPIWRALRREDA